MGSTVELAPEPEKMPPILRYVYEKPQLGGTEASRIETIKRVPR